MIMTSNINNANNNTNEIIIIIVGMVPKPTSEIQKAGAHGPAKIN